MNLANINSVLRTRALADTGSGGMFNTTTPLINAWNWNAVPVGTSYPYVIQSVASSASQNAQQLDVIECRYRFGIWHERISQSDTDPLLKLSQIEARIYGDWSKTTPTTPPTYGFHRFTPTFTGFTCVAGGMEYVNAFDESDGDLLHLVLEFRFWVNGT